MIDTNTLALAQQIQDIKEGLAAAQALLRAMGGVSIGGVSVAALAAYLWRRKWMNSAVVAHLEEVAEHAVVAGDGMAETLANAKAARDAK